MRQVRVKPCIDAAPGYQQDAVPVQSTVTSRHGVSGIPSGPGSVGGVNNSVNDPSGIGNASKVPPPPPPSTCPSGR
jgi:hypothetical protein